MIEDEPLNLKSGEAGRLLGVRQETMSRYAKNGRLPFQLTDKGQYRFRKSDVLALWEEVNGAQRR